MKLSFFAQMRSLTEPLPRSLPPACINRIPRRSLHLTELGKSREYLVPGQPLPWTTILRLPEDPAPVTFPSPGSMLFFWAPKTIGVAKNPDHTFALKEGKDIQVMLSLATNQKKYQTQIGKVTQTEPVAAWQTLNWAESHLPTHQTQSFPCSKPVCFSGNPNPEGESVVIPSPQSQTVTSFLKLVRNCYWGSNNPESSINSWPQSKGRCPCTKSKQWTGQDPLPLWKYNSIRMPFPSWSALDLDNLNFSAPFCRWTLCIKMPNDK